MSMQNRQLRRLARPIAIGAGAGFIAGLIAGGVGSRIAMRIIALADSSKNGLITENGNIVGEVTLDGTLGLLFFAAVFFGTFGGLLYIAIRRWIPGSGLGKGVSYGVFLLLVGNRTVIDPDNVDFRLLDPPHLSVSLFALVFILYGLILSPIVERFDRYVPASSQRPLVTFIGYVVLAGLSVFGFVLFVTAIGDIL